MLRHQNIHTRLTDPTNTFRTSIAFFEIRDSLTSSAVYLDTLRREGRGGVGEAARFDVKDVTGLTTLDGGEWFGGVVEESGLGWWG
jgi:hypothetical protein